MRCNYVFERAQRSIKLQSSHNFHYRECPTKWIPSFLSTLSTLGHQLLSFHHTHNIREQEFRARIELFTTRYPAPENLLLFTHLTG